MQAAETNFMQLYAEMCIPGPEAELEMACALEKYMQERFGHVPLGGMDTYSPAALVLEPEQLQYLKLFSSVLDKALKSIVANYFNDERIRRMYDLDPFFDTVLAMCNGIPFDTGACRPDFLQTPDGHFRICEIGARFPLNGWMISYYINRFGYTQQAEASGLSVPQDRMNAIPEVFAACFETGKKIALLMEQEKGSEIHWLLHELQQRGHTSEVYTPGSLQLLDGRLMCKGEELTQFILEMDREELRQFHPEVLRTIIRSGRYFNDVRTLILLHDKRVLAVLYDRQIMGDYLSKTEYQLLQEFLVPSYSLSDPEIRNRICSGTQNWVLKRSSGGRGVDMYLRSECSEDFWRETVNTQWPHYMVQTFVPQRKYMYKGKEIQVVGLLLLFNGHFFGTGIYRGSGYSVVNVHQGRGTIFPPGLCQADIL